VRGRHGAWLVIAAMVAVGMLATQAFAGCESDIPPSCPPKPTCPPTCQSANVGVGSVGATQVPGNPCRSPRKRIGIWTLINLRALAAAMSAK